MLVPVFDQAEFLPQALGGLLAQRGPSWELVVVDDGSTDDLAAALRTLPAEVPVRVLRHPENRGLGAACNTGLDAAQADVIAYLPADDVWFDGHLAALVDALDRQPGAILAHGELDDPTVDAQQLVQLAHRRTELRWRTRADVESDDLGLLFLDDLRAAGPVAPTGRVSCRWVRHPGQRSRTFDPAEGGLNVFRRRYRAAGPLRFAPRHGAAVDEQLLYPDPLPPAPAPDAPHVLLVGELAYNPDRLLLLAERNVRMTGLWIDDPLGFMSVGPLPFGRVAELPRTGWLDALRRDPPDVAYCLLNWRTIPLALALAEALPSLPLVWHFKEAPQRSLDRGDWPLLARLWRRADHVLLASREERDWLELALPGQRDPAATGVMDGDLPRGRWFTGPVADRTDRDGVHTVCVGRPVGLTPAVLAELAAADVHVHLHGVRDAGPADPWLVAARAAAPRHLHLHPAVAPPCWRRELSRYDAGWLHVVPAVNGGDLRRATWDDLNLPARLPTLAAAGLPVLVPDPGASVNAVARTTGEAGVAVRFSSPGDAAERLRDLDALAATRAAMDAGRSAWAFESAVDDLHRILLATADRQGRR
ncbi:glycosyltransferase family A protein [Nakamurella endophytica]|uniref:glycosyltransferase family A protein n=1 Tax=Nakamurella endophytica TaxID=1748367 RepID=UPI00166BEAB9|nr:glycosyltransferase family A protein [Nakamurella endophytica]